LKMGEKWVKRKELWKFKVLIKMKYKYWHIIIDVSKEWQKKNPIFYIGQVITNRYKRDNQAVCMMDLEKGKEYPEAYTLGYLGRFESKLKSAELIKRLKQSIIENGYYDIWKKAQHTAIPKDMKKVNK